MDKSTTLENKRYRSYNLSLFTCRCVNIQDDPLESGQLPSNDIET